MIFRIVMCRACGIMVMVVLIGIPPARAESVAEITQKIRGALGIDAFEAQAKAVQLTGETEFLGLKGDFTFVFDQEGRFSRNYEVAVPNEAVYDGKTVRIRDLGGEVCDQSQGDRTGAINNALAMTGLWFSKSRADGFELVEKDSTKKTVVLRRDIDDGRSWARVVIDRTTWRPTNWEFQTPTGIAEVKMEGTTQVGPLTMASKVSILGPHGGDNILIIRNSKLVAVPDWSKELASLRCDSEATFEHGGQANIETKRAPTGHLLVHPTIDGKDLGWFIFDTGAGQNVIDNRAIEEAGLKSFASIPAVGVGGATKASLVRSKTLKLGRMTMHKPLLIGMDLAFLDVHMGEKIAGVIGYGALARCVVEFDQAEGHVSIHNPTEYSISGGQWTPLMLYGRHPCVPGKFEGHDAVFRLDTGASGTVTFHAPTVSRLKLLDHRKTRPSSLGGVGGFKPARTGKVKSLDLGGRKYKKIKADFATESSGAFADPYIDANIGGDLIGESVLILDYPNSRIAFKKRAEE